MKKIYLTLLIAVCFVFTTRAGENISFNNEDECWIECELPAGWPINGCRDFEVGINVGVFSVTTTIRHCCHNGACITIDLIGPFMPLEEASDEELFPGLVEIEGIGEVELVTDDGRLEYYRVMSGEYYVTEEYEIRGGLRFERLER